MTALVIDRIRIDLVEHGLFGQTEVVVALTVELVAVDAAEIADTRQRQRQKTIEELPHAVATQGDVRADGLAFTQVELRDGLLRLGDLRLLAGDGGQIAHCAFDELRVAGRGADAHGDDDLLDAGNLHRVVVLEFLLELRDDDILVLLLQARSLRCSAAPTPMETTTFSMRGICIGLSCLNSFSSSGMMTSLYSCFRRGV